MVYIHATSESNKLNGTHYNYYELIAYLLDEKPSQHGMKIEPLSLQKIKYLYLLNQPFMTHFSSVKLSVPECNHG